MEYKTLVSCIVTTLCLPLPVYATGDVHWGYDGDKSPEHWEELSPNYAVCKLGKEQSPINIEDKDSIPTELPPLQFDYHPVPLVIENNGHTIKMTAPAGTLAIGKDTYKLEQFHTHSPSEETINGQHFDLVLHFVHKNEANQHTVVALFLQKGQENPLLDKLWTVLPEKQGSPKTYETQVDLSQLLPKDKSYYTYPGSLTVPPCTEGVKWIVLKQPTTLSEEQLAKHNAIYSHNARPLQPLNGRKVLSSK